MQRCVTCWASGDHFFDLRKCCYLKTSLKEAIVLLVPDMVATIQDDDKVCKKCMISLETSVKFIGQCLFVQEQLKSGKYKKTVEGDDINEVSQEDKTVSIDVEEAPTTSVDVEEAPNTSIDAEEAPTTSTDHDYSVQDKVLEQIGEVNTVISVRQPNIERLKILVNMFCKSDIAVYDQSEFLGFGSKSKRILLLGSYRSNCMDCLIQFTSIKALQMHKIFECKSNKPPIQTEAEAATLLEIKTMYRKYKCGFCSERFVKFGAYKQHFRKKHPFYCRRCIKLFPDLFSLTVHKKEFHVKVKKAESYLCDICGKHFSLGKKFFAHKQVHNRPELPCEKCGKLFKGKVALGNHLLIHREKTLECDVCFKKYRNYLTLRQHIRSVHKPEELNFHYQCDICGKLLKNNKTLSSHKIHVHSSNGPFNCPECNRSYTAEFYLQRHIKLVHRGNKRPKKVTQQKIKNYQVKNSIANRLRAISPGELLPCKICGKYFKGFNRLKFHLERHVPTKRFACDYCGITLKNLPCLKKHQQLHLSSNTVHRCNVCWKPMSSEEERQNHMIIHDKPRHQCDECGEFFHRKFLLNDHVLIHHTNSEDLQMSQKKIIEEAIDAINETKVESAFVMDEEYLEDYVVSSEDIEAVASIKDENNIELEFDQKNVEVVTNNSFYHVND